MTLSFESSPVEFSAPEGRRVYKLLAFWVFDTDTPRTGLTVTATIAGDPHLSLHGHGAWSPSGAGLVSEEFSLDSGESVPFSLFLQLDETAPAGTLDASVTLTIGVLAEVVVDITATVTAQAPIQLGIVLDRSASMGLPATATAATPTRSDRMREAASLCRLLLNDADEISLILFNDTATTRFSLGRVDTPPEGSSATRGEVLQALLDDTTPASELLPMAATSIPNAVTETQSELPLGTGQAALYITDGMNDLGTTVGLPAWTGTRFAVGIIPMSGDFVRASAHLSRLAGTKRALLWTDTSGASAFKLEKYVTQTLLNVGGASVLLDPDGVLDAEHPFIALEFDVTEADFRYDVIALSDHPERLRIRLVPAAPQGQGGSTQRRIVYAAAVDEDDRTAQRPPSDARHCDAVRPRPRDLGPRARVLRGELRQDSGQRPKRLAAIISAPGLQRRERVRYSIVVGVQSGLRLDAELHASDLYVGAELLFSAVVTQQGDVLRKHLKLSVELRYPDGGRSVHALEPALPGRYTLRLPTFRPGVYEARFIARGRSHFGVPFTREELRTVAILDATARLDPVDSQNPSPTPNPNKHR